MALHMPSRRSRLATATAFGLAAAIVAFGGTAPANAEPGDTAEAEGRFLTLTNVPQVIALDGAYTSYGPGDTAAQVEDAPLDVDVLNGLANAQLSAGVTLGSLLDLDQAASAGVLQQYASAGPAGATGAAGAVSDSGAITVGAGGGGQQTVIDLGSTIASIGAQNTLSDLSLRFGAISSTVTSTGTGTPASDYDIASAEAVLTSPLVAQISSRLTTAVNGIAPGIAGSVDVSAATGPLLEGILGENLVTSVLRVGTPTVVATANVNTAAVVNAALAQPLTNADGTVSIDVSAGTITVDLDRIQALNDRPAGTSVLSSELLAGVVDSAITNIFTEVLPNRLVTALRTSTTVNVAVTAPLTTGLLNANAGTLGVDVNLSLDRLLGGTTGTAPTISLARTNLIGLTVNLTTLAPLFDDLVTGLIGTNADTDLLPAIGTALTGVSTGVITALAPAFPVVDQVVRLTVNEQTPDAFIDGDGVDAGSSSVTALRVRLLGNGGPTVDLARSTVRAVPAPVADDVTITTPTPNQVIELPAGQTTVVVPVTGTADPDAEVTLTVGGQTVGPQPVGPGNAYTLTPPALPAGTYTATVTQTIDGQAAGSATVTFTVAPAATGITITTPTAGQVFLTTATDPTVDVPVEGEADVRASVTVSIPGQTAQTELVGTDGRYDVVFADLPVGTYTATATQSIDGVVRGSETVTFTVGAPAVGIAIDSPTDDQEIPSSGTGPNPTADVPVTGTADPRASVTVTIPGRTSQTDTTVTNGRFDVLFPNLPVGTYTATATQTIGGVAVGTDMVTFVVGAPAEDVVIDTPTNGQTFTIPAGGTTTDVIVNGSADPRATVVISLPGRDDVTQVVGDDGRFETTFTGLTAASYDVTVTQSIGGAPAGSDTASFTVQIAGIEQVVIETPEPGDFIPLAAGTTTVVVPVTGTADPAATVTLTVGGTTTGPVEVDDDGGFTLTPPALPAGTYTATVTQTIGGQPVGSDTVTFTIGAPVTITAPTAGQEYTLPTGATGVDVTVSGRADPIGTVTVTITGRTPIEVEVGDDGTYEATFTGVPVGSYTATATQTIGGAAAGSADPVTFTVTAGAADGGTDATAAVDVDGGADAAGADAAGTDAAGTDAAGTDAAGTDAAGTDAAGTDAAGTDAAGTDAAGTDAAGTDAAGTDAAGTDAAGTDAAGTDAAGTDAAGTDAAGTDAAGTDAAGTDAAGTDAAGTDAAGTDAAGTDAAGTDAAGTDAAGTDAAGTDAAGTDAAGTDAAGTDAAGTDAAGTDAAGTDAAGTDAAGTDAAGTDAAGTDAAGTDAAGTDAAGTDAAGTDAAGTDAAGTDAAGTDAAGTDAAGTDAAGTDAAGTDAAGTDAAGTDAAGTDAAGTDAAGTDAAGTDAAGTDAAGTDAAGTDAAGTDAAGTDAAGTDAAGTDAAGTDAAGTDAAGTDAAGTDAAGTDAAGTDAAGTDAAGTDAAGTDAAGTDAAGTDAAGTDAAGTDAAGTDAAGTDAAGTDAAGTDAAGTDAAGTDAAGTDAAGTDAAGTDAAGTDAAGTDAAGTDAAGTDAAGTDAAGTDAAGADASDAAGTDATDAAGADASDAAGTDATDAAGADATDAAGADASDAAGADATDAAGADASDAAGADASDASDGSTDGSDAPTRATVSLPVIVRGTGVVQEVTAENFTPGETILATVNSTPMPLEPKIADADGRATFTFPVGADFELGAHSVTVTGTESGPADEMLTQFQVVAATVPAGQPGPVLGGGGYGGGILPVTGGDADGLLLLGGIALLMMLTGAGALHRSRSRRV
ncbi:sortase [Clavibacter michiganensis]|nr:sortase [Clavibacter michiganensis]